MNAYRKAAVLAATLALAWSVPGMAQNSPFVPGDYVEVSSVTVDDGHGLDYENFLASTWRERQEFAKKQGWIDGYEVLANVNARAGEPDLILVTRFKSMPDAAEQMRRDDAMRAYDKQTDAQMQAASGDRAKYRHLAGTQLWQELKFK